jgi:outer membrane protein TolC
MDRRHLGFRVIAWISVLLLSGCQPTQPFFLNEDGDLSHYLDTATEIDYPDVAIESLPDAAQAKTPHSVINSDEPTHWDLSLQEVVSISLANSKVIRSIAQVRQTRQVGQGVAGPPETLTLNPDFTPTIYDPAIEESGPNGVETALSAFDAQWNTNVFWEKTDRPQNVDADSGSLIFARLLDRDAANFQSELTKRAATGTQWSFRNISTYDASNRPLKVQASEWLTSFEAEARHPLLRGGGTEVNRVPVLLARIRTDISLAQFDQAVRDHLIEIERAYWDLYFFYRNLETAKVGRNSALGTWKRIWAMGQGPNVAGEQEAQSREQYFFFRGRLEEAKRDLLIAERQLRYLMGIAPTDDRIIRPIDHPTLARVKFDWSDILTESLTRAPEIRRQKWLIQQRELELIAARNTLLPQVDLVALYRWLGLGDDLWQAERDGTNFPDFGSLAFDELSEGRFQEWRLGVDVKMPLGARAGHAAVRNSQLTLARDKARLEDLELEISHGLTDAVQRLDANYALTQTAFLQRSAAETQVKRLEAKVDVGAVPLDLLLDAQRREADAERAFFQSLLQYNLAILEVHYRKGSLLEYCGVALQEGPWPAKAYFDALIRARQRDASYYFDYGFTRPDVVSRGPVEQNVGPDTGNVAEAHNIDQPTLVEPNPNVPSDAQPALESPTDNGSETGSADQQLHDALRQALTTDLAEGPALNAAQPAADTVNERPSAVGTSQAPTSGNRFEWDAIFD